MIGGRQPGGGVVATACDERGLGCMSHGAAPE